MQTTDTNRFSLFSSVRNFFFAEQSPYAMALVRMFLPAVALVPMIRRFGRVREMYSSDGAPLQLFQIYGEGSPLPELPASFAAALYGLMIFALICGVFGFRTRLALMIGTPLYIYFNLLDCAGTMTKYSVMAAHMLVILSLSHCGSVWSIDAILRRSKEAAAATAIPPRFPVWPARLIQILFCVVYLGAAITKIQTASFFSGEQMKYWMLSNWNYDNPVGEIMATSTPLLLASGYIAVLWEIGFGLLAWRPIGRFFALGMGCAFHFMTWLTLGLYIFPLICISGYLAFLTEQDIVAIRQFVHRLRIPTALLGAPRFAIARLIESRPSAVPVSLAWLGMATLVAVGSAEADYRIDLYGMRANNGPMALKLMDRDVALVMISTPRPLREKDKFFSFDVGNMLVGGQLANRLNVFEPGDTIIAQCNVNPPHEDLWVECFIEDDQERVIDNSGQFVTRDVLFANFTYFAGDRLVPGDYWMVLKSSGKEISRRPFTLAGEPKSLPQAAASELLTN